MACHLSSGDPRWQLCRQEERPWERKSYWVCWCGPWPVEMQRAEAARGPTPGASSEWARPIDRARGESLAGTRPCPRATPASRRADSTECRLRSRAYPTLPSPITRTAPLRILLPSTDLECRRNWRDAFSPLDW